MSMNVTMYGLILELSYMSMNALMHGVEMKYEAEYP